MEDKNDTNIIDPPDNWDSTQVFCGLSAKDLFELGNDYAVTFEWFNQNYPKESLLLQEFFSSNVDELLTKSFTNQKWYVEINSSKHLKHMFTATNGNAKIAYFNGCIYDRLLNITWIKNSSGVFIEL